jgi:hypothetical protein
MRADEIATKTGKVTVVVAVMIIYCKTKNQFAERYFRGQEAFSPKGQKCQLSGGKFPQAKKPFSENKKRPFTKEIST